MAERRMFAKTIIDSDAFLEMPISARLLYYDLGMRADDDGFINSPKKIMRAIGSSQDDMNILIMRKFVIPFETGIVVIKHWMINNYIRCDRYKETKYIDEKNQLQVNKNGSYTINNHSSVSDKTSVGIPTVYQMDTQYRLGKDRLGKDRLNMYDEKNNSIPIEFNVIDEIPGVNIDDKELLDEFNRYLVVLKNAGKFVDQRKSDRLLKQLFVLSENKQEQLEIIKQSSDNGWFNFYPLKKSSNRRDIVIPQSKYMQNSIIEERNISEDEFEKVKEAIKELKEKV